MKKKKVLFLIESFIVGGAEKVLIDIVNNLNQEKYDITVCSVYKHSVYKGYDKSFDKPFKTHIKYRYLIDNRIKILYILFNYLLNKIPNLLYQLFIGNRYDTVVAFYEGLPTYWLSQAKLEGCKKIAWLHTSTELSQQGKNQEELDKQQNYYAQFNQIIAVSQGVTDSFIRLFPTLSHIKVIYNPINTTVILEKAQQPISLEKKVSPTFVCVGRMTEVKGYDRWLRVLLKLKEKGYVFQSWIIGGGNRDKYEQFVIENNFKDYVVFLGHQDNPYPYMAEADWIACPSYLEGLSTVVLEGIALGKAIVSTDCPGMKELLGENKYGIVCQNDEKSISQQIERVLLNPELQNLFESSVSLCQSRFEIKQSIKKIESII